MSKASELLLKMGVLSEGKKGMGDLAKFLERLDKPSYNSFLAILAGALDAEAGKIVPTDMLGRVMKKVITEMSLY